MATTATAWAARGTDAKFFRPGKAEFAAVPAESVDYVNAHATSTLIGDISEARALRSVFRNAATRPLVSSTKALTGHGLSLAGAMETGFCALALRD